MWKTKNYKNQLGSLKKQTLILTLPQEKSKKINPFSSLALQLLSQLNNYIIFLP
jgi:hypothetical protein